MEISNWTDDEILKLPIVQHDDQLFEKVVILSQVLRANPKGGRLWEAVVDVCNSVAGVLDVTFSQTRIWWVSTLLVFLRDLVAQNCLTINHILLDSEAVRFTRSHSPKILQVTSWTANTRRSLQSTTSNGQLSQSIVVATDSEKTYYLNTAKLKTYLHNLDQTDRSKPSQIISSVKLHIAETWIWSDLNGVSKFVLNDYERKVEDLVKTHKPSQRVVFIGIDKEKFIQDTTAILTRLQSYLPKTTR